MRRPGVVLLATGLLSAPACAIAQDAGDPEAGLKLALKVCSSCHAVEAGQVLSPLERAPAFEDIADKPGVTGMALTAFLTTPHVSMPDLILEPGEISDIVAHILHLRDS